MNTQLKAAIEIAIENTLNEFSEGNYWDEYIHPELVKQMASAAEFVFDSAQDAQDAQKYYKHTES